MDGSSENEQATAKPSVLPFPRLEPDLWEIVNAFGHRSLFEQAARQV
jgi:hypothetical protein